MARNVAGVNQAAGLNLALAAMRTGFGIEAIFGDAQSLYGTAGDQMFGDDFGGVSGLHVAVPNRIRVDDHRGAMFALIEAPGFVDAHAPGESRLFAELLKAGMQFAFSVTGAGRTGRFRRADIVAYEDMAFKPWQTGILLVQA